MIVEKSFKEPIKTMNLNDYKTKVEKVYKLKANKNFKDLENITPNFDFSVLSNTGNLIRICKENKKHFGEFETTLKDIIEHNT
jgi:hypothetical protein